MNRSISLGFAPLALLASALICACEPEAHDTSNLQQQLDTLHAAMDTQQGELLAAQEQIALLESTTNAQQTKIEALEIVSKDNPELRSQIDKLQSEFEDRKFRSSVTKMSSNNCYERFR